MRESSANSMDALRISIETIGNNSKEMAFKSKKIVEKLKKNRTELIQDSFDNAFYPDGDTK